MANRSIIGYTQDDAYTFTVLRADSNPYPKKGKISQSERLNDDYLTFEDVADLIDGGEIIEIGASLNTTKYESNTEPSAFFEWSDVIKYAKNKNASYVYLFDKGWFFSEFDEKMSITDLKPLSDAVNSKNETFKSFRTFIKENKIEISI